MLFVGLVLAVGCGRVRYVVSDADADAGLDARVVVDAAVNEDAYPAVDANNDAGTDVGPDFSACTLPACAQTCVFEVATGALSCSVPGLSAFTSGPSADQWFATLDPAGWSTVEFTVTACDPTGFWFHVADDETANGAGGDGSGSEFHTNGDRLELYPEVGPDGHPAYYSASTYASRGCTDARFVVGNNAFTACGHVYDVSMDARVIDLDDPIYIGINRVRGGDATRVSNSRTGTGVQRLKVCFR